MDLKPGILGRVEALGIAPAAGQAIEPRERITLLAGVGIEGDRYAAGAGKFQDSPDHELTFAEAEAAEAARIAPLLLRRNVVTRGVRLGSLFGQRFQLGEAIILGVRSCDPCGYMERLNGRPGLKASLAERGGLRARIERGGDVRLGDVLTLLPKSPAPEAFM